ncbi:hypothetical protein GOP47_0030616 [Adiantum capillus-veneris]|nr:hypothetical protein GOP47_0030616 [Adiantum capillus-veneris]
MVTSPAIPIPQTQEPVPGYGATPPQVVVNSNQTPYYTPNPYMTAPTNMLQTGTPPPPALTEERVVQVMTITVGELKEEILSALRPQKKEVYDIAQQAPGPSISAPLMRSNVWCGKCNDYGHLATECPTTSRVVPYQVRTLF